MKYIKQWLNQVKNHYQARSWLTSNDPDKVAARCLFCLNRVARQTPHQAKKHFIYTCKKHLVRIFYERGYCISLTRQRQALRCWHTREYNEGWEDYCEKCGNTGWYRQHHLYCFVFEIGGRRYGWHQPESMVTWPVTVTDPDVGEYKLISDPGEGSPLTKEMGDLYRAVLYQYLLGQGIPRNELPSIITLRQALRDEWYWNVTYPIAPWRLKWWLMKQGDRLRGWLDHQTEVRAGDWALLPEEVPVRLVRVKKIGYSYTRCEQVALLELSKPLLGSLTCTWKARRLQSLALRVKLAKLLLRGINRAWPAGPEDEIPF